MTVASLETTISAVTASLFAVDRRHCRPDDAFALLGLDSLSMIELAAALEETLGCELPPDLLSNAPMRSLARRLADAEAPSRPPIDDPLDRMFADSVLPQDVRPRDGATSAQPGRCSTHVRSCSPARPGSRRAARP